MRSYLKLWAEWQEAIEPLDMEARGRLLTALLEYCNTGVEPELPGVERITWAAIRGRLRRDAEEYERSAEKARENGARGGRPRNPVGSSENPENPVGFLKTQGNPEEPKETQKKLSNKQEARSKKQEARSKKQEARSNNKRAMGNAKRFQPPTVEEVAEYCRERNNNIDPQRFVDYYTAQGWTVGNGKPMCDWKAAVRTWEHRDKEGKRTAAGARPPSSRSSFDAAMREMLGAEEEEGDVIDI